MVVRGKVGFITDKIQKGLLLIPSFICNYKYKKQREMEVKELFRACCYMIIEEKMCSISLIQRRMGVNYKDAAFVFKMLLENDLIKAEYKPTIKSIEKMEQVLDKIYK